MVLKIKSNKMVEIPISGIEEAFGTCDTCKNKNTQVCEECVFILNDKYEEEQKNEVL